MIEISPGEWGPEIYELMNDVWVPLVAFTGQGTVMDWLFFQIELIINRETKQP